MSENGNNLCTCGGTWVMLEHRYDFWMRWNLAHSGVRPDFDSSENHWEMWEGNVIVWLLVWKCWYGIEDRLLNTSGV